MNSPNYAFAESAFAPETLTPNVLRVEDPRVKVISVFALCAIVSSLTPMPAGFESPVGAVPRDTSDVALVPIAQPAQPAQSPRPSMLNFAVNAVQSSVTQTAETVSQTVQTAFWPEAPTDKAWTALPVQSGWADAQLFQAQSDSLVAKAVGSAEGTRRPDGGKNPAYRGHVDPGNAVWNVGTFSYQHCGNCAPAEADRRQLARLAQQFAQIQAQARDRYGVQLSLEEQLNAIDLANQAPLAALAQGGFIDRLQQAKQQGLSGSDAILQARVYAYKNPHTNRWEAPGLGNTKPRITQDQARRQAAIATAIQQHSAATIQSHSAATIPAQSS
jgi:hypothetical protein